MSRNTWILIAVAVAVFIGAFTLGGNARNPADCPASAREAGKLFGGSANLWSQVDGGWSISATRRLAVTVPAWYARAASNADGSQTFVGAVVANTKVTLQTGQSLTLVCPLR